MRLYINITSTALSSRNDFDAYQVERLLSSASTILDRCLMYRRELYTLEEQAIRRALEYRLFNDQYQAQLSIELAQRIEQQKKAEKDGQEAAANEFSKDASSALAKGFDQIATSSASSSAIAITSEQERKQNVRNKWQALVTFQSALEDRHNAPGNPLNYSERYNRIRGLLEPDIAVAVKKLQCVSLIVKQLWGIDMPLPQPTELGYLDTLVSYTRVLINEIEIGTSEEIDFDHVVSLRQPRAAPASQLITDPQWNTALDPNTGNGVLSFSLAQEFPSAIAKLRVRNIGISMMIEAYADIGARLRTTSVVVFPPPVPDVFNPAAQRVRPPVIVEEVGLYGQNSPKMYPAIGILNIDPRDQWQIQVSHTMLWPDGVSHGRYWANIRDLKVHLGLSAVVNDKKIGAWSGINW